MYTGSVKYDEHCVCKHKYSSIEKIIKELDEEVDLCINSTSEFTIEDIEMMYNAIKHIKDIIEH